MSVTETWFRARENDDCEIKCQDKFVQVLDVARESNVRAFIQNSTTIITNEAHDL